MRREREHLLVVDAGGMFLKTITDALMSLPLVEVRSPLFIGGLNVMGYDAANVGETDLALPAGLFARLEKGAAFPFLSANVETSGGERPFAPYRIFEYGPYKVGIFGVAGALPAGLGLDKADFRVRDHIKAARATVDLLRKKCRLVVALTSLGLDGDRRLAREVPGIDIILGGLSNRNLYTPEMEGNTFIVHAGHKGMRIGRLDVTVRPGAGGAWQEKRRAGKDAPRTYTWTISALDKRVADHPDVAALIENYKDTLKKEGIAEKVAPRPAGPAGYVGAAACGRCHDRELKEWLASDHAHAYDTLVNKRQEGNPECIPCHVTAYGRPGGFRPGPSIIDLRQVQCEACHGPGRGHRGRGGINRAVPAPACRTCHTPENSTEFDYRAYLEKLGPHVSPDRRQKPPPATIPLPAQ